MIVFDVDGTLIGGETSDWASFEGAFVEAAGFALTSDFFAGLEEVTAQAIVHQALSTLPLPERRAKERAVRDGYLRRLRAAYQNNPRCFPAASGALELLRELIVAKQPVAIATGDWRETISFKLSCAGLDVSTLPMMTSSEHYSRAEIIAAAVSAAGGALHAAIYIGDGLWDLRACRKLGIPFLGVGARIEKLRQAGANHTIADLTPATFWPNVAAARRAHVWPAQSTIPPR